MVVRENQAPFNTPAMVWRPEATKIPGKEGSMATSPIKHSP